MRFIAHRGCMAQYPENTLTAMRRSAPAVDMIETDVRRCGSGELVVFHDERLDRVTDATGRLAETPYEDLRAVDVLDSGEGVPLLEDVFEAVPSNVGLNLELKDDGVAADAVETAAQYDHDVVISAFDAEELSPAVDSSFTSVAYLFYEDPIESLDVATRLGCEYVHPHHRLCVGTDLIDRIHERGFEVNTWTVETAETLDELRELGVDGVVIDDCRLAGRSG